MVDIVIIRDNKLNNNLIKKNGILSLGGSDRQFTLIHHLSWLFIHSKSFGNSLKYDKKGLAITNKKSIKVNILGFYQDHINHYIEFISSNNITNIIILIY
jgi:hypothetical protein